MQTERKNVGPEAAWQKIKHYCAYSERSHEDVRSKLFLLGVSGSDADGVISKLIEENYLNEERFAIAYAGGKFRMNHWGRVKITHAMKQKNISSYCIKKALAAIDENEYRRVFEKLAIAKLKTLRGEKNIFSKKRKLYDFLAGKGYESDLIRAFPMSQ